MFAVRFAHGGGKNKESAYRFLRINKPPKPNNASVAGSGISWKIIWSYVEMVESIRFMPKAVSDFAQGPLVL